MVFYIADTVMASTLMTKEESSQYAIQAVTGAMLREDFTVKLGKIEYSITKYQG